MDPSSLPPGYLEFALRVENQLRKTLIIFSVLLGFVIAEALGHLDFDYRISKRIVKRRSVGAMTVAYFLTRIAGLVFIVVSFQQTLAFQTRFNRVTTGAPPEIQVISKAYSAIIALSASSASAILLLRLPALQNRSRFGLLMVAVVTFLLWVLGFVLTAFTKQLKTEGASRANLVSPTFAVPYFLWMLVDCFATIFLITSIMRQQTGLPKRGLLRRLLTDGVLFMLLSIAANLSTALVILKNLSNFFSVAASASINVVICSSAAQHLFRSQSRYVSNNKTFGVESGGIVSISKHSFSAHSPQERHSSSLSPDSRFYNSNANRFKARKALQRPLSNEHDLEELDAETFKEKRAFSVDIESGGSPRTPSGSERGLIRERTWSTGASQDLFTGVSKFSPFTSPTPKEHLQLQPLTPAAPASYKSATSSSRFHTPISMVRRGSGRTVQSRVSSAGQGFEIEDDATSTPPQLTLMDRRNVRGLAINDITPYLSRQSRSQYPSSIKSPLTNALSSSHEKSHQESEKVVSQNLPRLTNSLPAHFGNRREKDSEDDDSDLDPDVSDSRVMSKASKRDFKSGKEGLPRDHSFQSQASRSSSAQAQVPILPIKSDLRPTSITERLLVNNKQHHSTFSNYTSRPRLSQTPDVFDSTSLREANSSSPIHTESTSSRDCNHTILKHSQSYASLGDVTRVKNNSGDGEEFEEMEMKENASDDDES